MEAADEKPSIYIGNNVVIGDYCHIVGRYNLFIGDNVLIASKVFISDTSHGLYDQSNRASNPIIAPNLRKLHYKKVMIGNNVWIGENVSILPGVMIGDGSIIGANSVVTHDVMENSIVAGNPAKKIKFFDRGLNQWKVKK